VGKQRCRLAMGISLGFLNATHNLHTICVVFLFLDARSGVFFFSHPRTFVRVGVRGRYKQTGTHTRTGVHTYACMWHVHTCIHMYSR